MDWGAGKHHFRRMRKARFLFIATVLISTLSKAQTPVANGGRAPVSWGRSKDDIVLAAEDSPKFLFLNFRRFASAPASAVL
jgi:hypothetical protein